MWQINLTEQRRVFEGVFHRVAHFNPVTESDLACSRNFLFNQCEFFDTATETCRKF